MMLRNEILETKGLHIYSIPPALNVKYLNLTRGQLPTPRSATCNLGSKESGSDRTERKDAKMSFFTVFCVEIFSSFALFPFKCTKTNKTDSSDPQQNVTDMGAMPRNPHLLLHTHQKY